MPATQKDHCIDLHKTVVHSGLHAVHSIISYHRLQWIPLHQSLAPWRILWFGRHKFSLHCKHLFAVYVCISQHYTIRVSEIGPQKSKVFSESRDPQPSIHYFVAKLYIVRIYSFLQRKSACFRRAFNKSQLAFVFDANICKHTSSSATLLPPYGFCGLHFTLWSGRQGLRGDGIPKLQQCAPRRNWRQIHSSPTTGISALQQFATYF